MGNLWDDWGQPGGRPGKTIQGIVSVDNYIENCAFNIV